MEVVLNHMTKNFKKTSVAGTAGSDADPMDYMYPAVPYGPEDFHRPPCQVTSWRNAKIVSELIQNLIPNTTVQ